jgi:protease secretion system membrane fusion protein
MIIAKSQKPKAKSQKPKAKSQKPKAKSQKPKAILIEKTSFSCYYACVLILLIYNI